MKSRYDAEADALYVRFSDGTIEESQEVAPGIILDFDDQHRIIALEVLNARDKMAVGALLNAAE
ncbi:DUF2283 domain-containing protein [Azospirillum sp. sgz301742]